MKPTSRNNGHLRSDDGHTHRQTPNPLIDSAYPVGWAEWKGIICYRCDTSTAKSSHIALFHHGWTNNVLIVELHALRVTLLSPTLLQHWKSNSLLDDDNCCYNWSNLVRSSSTWYWWWLIKMVTDGPACGEQSQGSEVSFCHFERRAASDEITAWPTPSHHIWCVMYLMFHILHWYMIIRRQIHKSGW